MFKTMIAASLALLIFLSFGCTLLKPTPTEEDEWVMMVKVGSRIAAYGFSQSNPDKGEIVQSFLVHVDPESVLTYDQWWQLLTQIPLDPEWNLLLRSVFDVIDVYWGETTDGLTPLQKRLVVAFVTGTKEGIDMALNLLDVDRKES